MPPSANEDYPFVDLGFVCAIGAFLDPGLIPRPMVLVIALRFSEYASATIG